MTEWCPSALPGEDGCCPACGYVPGRLTRGRGLVRTHHTRERIATLPTLCGPCSDGDHFAHIPGRGCYLVQCSCGDDEAAAVSQIGDAVLDLVGSVERLGAAAKQRGDLPLEPAVQILAAMQDARRDLAMVEATIEAHIVGLWREQGRGRTMLEVEGAGVVEIHRTTDRKAWDHDALASAVIDAHMDGGTGEQPTPWEVRDWLMAAAAPSYWRIGALKAVGLRAGDFCTEVPGRDVVRLTR